ncbi:MAG TPA: serpin family protein [Amycolatopsis sp.]|uniref:serpin family protein n=1 Tax=Amycolatopsis sp. TaxID=37632 RepID=UPI002B4942DE|nr:serpin family protein [Amycolatopsis sp.]HKS45997.1 serpin family protein [Amycolatopsis sp.]
MTKPKLRGPERDHLRFCFALHRVLARVGSDSCFSPYSVASALGLTAQAAHGETAEELLGLLTGGDPDIAKQAELLRAAAILTEQRGRETPVLEVANTLWAGEELPLVEDFVGELAAWPRGGVKHASFRTDPERARRSINADVAKTTRDLIPQLLAPGSVDRDIVASIVNALYLKTAWLHRFSEAQDADFHSPSGTRRVPTMRQSERLGYAAEDGWQLVELPAVGEVAATILLPDGDLAEQESTMDEQLLAKLLARKASKQVRLAMPRVELDARAGLKDALRALGVRTMFDRAKADFTPLTPFRPVWVDDVVHQAVLRLDEQGLEGAAATAVTFRTLSMITAPPVEVVVDRPFLLLVRHAGTGVVYFFARVVEP